MGRAGETMGEALDALFAARGAKASQVPIILPAEPYLDTAGEALRRRIFLTRGEGGQNLCLRPDFTVPVCMRHIAEGADLPRRYSYRGLVFRQRAGGPAEFFQAGIEDLGEENRATSDARSLADALASLAACGVDPAGLDVILGDQGLFEAVLRALGLPEGWQRRLIRTFGHDGQLRAALARLAEGPEDALSGIEPQLVDLARDREEGALTRLVRDLMEEAGLPPHSGRSPGEIANRLIEKVQVAEARLGEGALELLQNFLALECPLDEAGDRLAAVTGTAGLDLGRAMTAFMTRNLALEAANVDLAGITYRAAFGRPIDYYTGLVFEVRETGAEEPLAGGGRYDRLMTILGAPAPIPAVGFSLWLDRIEAMARSTGKPA
ncbi:ATP phosphoribosyltransferase regulatory subunit [Jiella sonneratiae]|uniref:ATP phosphoribosyltransferase regulatory subunit n=1 Tax=Jiella sonneratiae TaxID=2816856 RepID=A0ABS3J3Z0_9HYPH|nr:ATP phosphoribosyltransferase regulatory subunit [Jiella sonneratiae]MBO0904389.1 ATP phosphoribosyltransferase regulatory subunit [Jiella sonneratiae]